MMYKKKKKDSDIFYLSPPINKMNIATLVLPSLFSTMSPSTLSNSDRNFIEFTRCLHKLKSVVKELQVFELTIKPSFAKVDHDYFQQVNSYLLNSFQKLNHLCKVLLIVLTKLESNHPVRQERIHSYRQELIIEWRKAIKVRQELVIFMGKTESQFSVISDEESDTTIEPYTSSDSSDS
ncbi:hypothetical protein BDF21DRAFT_418889 [Thamnidium elegans]|nr:hypothetical protein BDF21DRAFT_418889 [Thamnidium elegans]